MSTKIANGTLRSLLGFFPPLLAVMLLSVAYFITMEPLHVWLACVPAFAVVLSSITLQASLSSEGTSAARTQYGLFGVLCLPVLLGQQSLWLTLLLPRREIYPLASANFVWTFPVLWCVGAALALVCLALAKRRSFFVLLVLLCLLSSVAIAGWGTLRTVGRPLVEAYQNALSEVARFPLIAPAAAGDETSARRVSQHVRAGEYLVTRECDASVPRRCEYSVRRATSTATEPPTAGSEPSTSWSTCDVSQPISVHLVEDGRLLLVRSPQFHCALFFLPSGRPYPENPEPRPYGGFSGYGLDNAERFVALAWFGIAYSLIVVVREWRRRKREVWSRGVLGVDRIVRDADGKELCSLPEQQKFFSGAVLVRLAKEDSMQTAYRSNLPAALEVVSGEDDPWFDRAVPRFALVLSVSAVASSPLAMALHMGLLDR